MVLKEMNMYNEAVEQFNLVLKISRDIYDTYREAILLVRLGLIDKEVR